MQGADLEQAAGGAQLGSQTQFAVFVLGAIGLFPVGLEQAGAGAVGAGIELHAEQAQRIDAHAHWAFGKAGFVTQQEALGPFLGLVLRGAVLAEIAVEVEVAHFQAGPGVLEEFGAGVGTGGQSDERKEGVRRERVGLFRGGHGAALSCCCDRSGADARNPPEAATND
ncbi:hypothetical protein FQZ97_899450 [compost metagenome]